MLEIIMDTLLDSIKLLPFLFLTYLVMEYMEHRMGEKAKSAIEKSGLLGPFWGGIIGIFPQCGFSAAASNLYAGRIITLGTLIAIFLSTSDEMLPILISEQTPLSLILKLLGIKVVIGIAAGFLIDLFIRKRHIHTHEHMDIHHVCEHKHCRCEEGIFKSALRHTLQIFFFLVIISFVLNSVIYYAGEDFIANLILNKPMLGHLLSGIIGLIPNCAASVILTQLYLQGLMTLGTMMSGLLAGTGVGLLVLFRVNDNLKENLKITALLYAIGVAAGLLLDFLPLPLL